MLAFDGQHRKWSETMVRSPHIRTCGALAWSASKSWAVDSPSTGKTTRELSASWIMGSIPIVLILFPIRRGIWCSSAGQRTRKIGLLYLPWRDIWRISEHTLQVMSFEIYSPSGCWLGWCSRSGWPSPRPKWIILPSRTTLSQTYPKKDLNFLFPEKWRG